MDFQKLLGNKALLGGIIGGIILIIVVFVVLGLTRPQGASDGKVLDPDENKKIEGTVELVTSDNMGKIIEIEALLAQHKIQTQRMASGSKITLTLKPKSTLKQRDQAFQP